IVQWEFGIKRIFFFQAEDGIRDRNVTGVQTCALPICSKPYHGAGIDRRRSRGYMCCAVRWSFSPRPSPLPWGEGEPCSPRRTIRSEERRVGKECRSQWWTDQYKEKKRVRERTESIVIL